MYLYINNDCDHCLGSGSVFHTEEDMGAVIEQRCSCVREINAETVTSMLLSQITAPESNEALLAAISEYGNLMHHAGMLIGEEEGRGPRDRAKAKFELITTYIRLCFQVKENI